MSKNLLFDEEVIKAKRIFNVVEQNSKKPLNYIYKHKNLYTKIGHNKYINNKQKFRNTEVVVKITSGSKHYQAFSKHIDYISRDGNVELITNEYEAFLGNQEKLELKNIFRNEGAPIPQYNQEKRERKHTINMVFSMKEHEDVPQDKLKVAVIESLKKIYPDNLFVVAFHGDTDNPHCHVCLKVANKHGKRIHIKKADLANMRLQFAKELNKLGIDAKATFNEKFRQYIAKEQEQDKSNSISKLHYYEVLDYGKAPYKFATDKNAKESFFVKYKTKKGITTIWGKDLERVIRQNQVVKGEFVKFRTIGAKNIPLQIQKETKTHHLVLEKMIKQVVWDCSVIGREKEFVYLKNEPIRQHYKILQSIPKKHIRMIKEDYGNHQTINDIKQQTIQQTHDYKEQNYDKRNYYKGYRQRILSESNINRNRKKAKRARYNIHATTNRKFVRVLPKLPMVYNQPRVAMLLQQNALPNIFKERSEKPNTNVRWADIGINRD